LLFVLEVVWPQGAEIETIGSLVVVNPAVEGDNFCSTCRDKCCPCRHQFTPLFEQISTAIGRLSLVLGDVGKRGLANLAG
jgi:hypothetical protein